MVVTRRSRGEGGGLRFRRVQQAQHGRDFERNGAEHPVNAEQPANQLRRGRPSQETELNAFGFVRAGLAYIAFVI